MKDQTRDRVIARLGRSVDRATKQRKGMSRTISPTEQLQRYLVGAERARVDADKITEDQYQRYAQKMEKELARRLRDV